MTDFRARPALLLRDEGASAAFRLSAASSSPGSEPPSRTGSALT
jgi:hypothetical protein